MQRDRKARRSVEDRLEAGDVRFRCETEHFDVEHTHAMSRQGSINSRNIEAVLVGLPGHRDEAKSHVRVARHRCNADLLLVRQLENRERREPDGPVHFPR